MEFIIGFMFVLVMFWMIVVAIQSDQLWWALGMFLIFPLTLPYGILYWDRAKAPFLIGLAAGGLALLSA